MSKIAICQEIDTTNLLTSALIQSIDFTGGTWSTEEVAAILKQKNQVNIRELRSKGMRGIFFFQLNFPEFGLVKGSTKNNTEVFNPNLFHHEKVFALDIVTNNLYVLDDTFSDDTLEFYYLVQHRLVNYNENIYKKRVWLSELAIEGISMRYLWKKATRLQKLKFSLKRIDVNRYD